MNSANDRGPFETDADNLPQESQVELIGDSHQSTRRTTARSKATVGSSKQSTGTIGKGQQIKNWACRALKMDTDTVGLGDVTSSRSSTMSSMEASGAIAEDMKGESRLRQFIRDSIGQANDSDHHHHHIDPNAVELSVLVEVGHEDAAQMSSCKGLPVLLFIWSLFMVCTSNYAQVTRFHIGERPFRDLLKKAAQLSRHDEIVPWLQNVYLPYFWTQSQSADNRTRPRDLIAGVELTLSQAVQIPCRDSAAAHLTCFSGRASNSTKLLTLPLMHGKWYRHYAGRRMQGGPAYATAEPDDSKTNRSLEEHHHLRMLKLLFPKYVDFPNNIVFKFHSAASELAQGSMVIPSDASLAWAQSSLTALNQDAHSIHPSTLWLAVRSLTHNLQDSGLVTLFELQFHLHRGGGVFAEGLVFTVDTKPVKEVFKVLGIMWACCIAASSIFHLLLVCQLIRQKKMHQVPIILVFFTSQVLAWIIFAMFFTTQNRVHDLTGELQAFQQGLANSTQQLPRYQLQAQSARNLLNSAQQAGYASDNMMIIAVNYIVLMVGRLLVAIAGQPRLAITLNAIRRASSDVVALGILSLIALLGFATGGHIMLGKRLEPYSTMLGASDACFEIALTRNYPWDEISERNLFTAAIWGHTMIVVMLFFFVMMFLAVVIQSYTEVRSTRGLGQTLWQSAESVTSMYWGRFHNQWWSPAEFVHAAKRINAHRLTLPQLKEELPEMPEASLNKIFQLAQERKQSRRESHMSPGDIIEKLSGIYLGCRELQTNMPLPSGERPASVFEMSSASTDTKPDKPPSEPPNWVNVELMSHFKKQVHLMRQMHSDLTSFKNSLREQMHAEGLPPSPYTISAPQAPMWNIMSPRCNSVNTDSNSSHWNLPGPPSGALKSPNARCPSEVDMEPPVRRIRSQAIGQIFSLGHMPRPSGDPA